MTSPALPSRSRGQTLLETLVACLVLAVALAGFAAALVGALAAERDAATHSLALRHAEAAAEEIRLLRWLEPAQRARRIEDLEAALTQDTQRQLPLGAVAGISAIEPDRRTYRIAIGWPAGGGTRGEVLLWVR